MMAARRAKDRAGVDKAKQALGERGTPWWSGRDFNRYLAKNTPYAEWYRNQQFLAPLSDNAEASMAVNRPTGDNARKGAVKKRTQLKNPLTKTSTKRNKKGGQFMAVKKSAKKFKGVRREK